MTNWKYQDGDQSSLFISNHRQPKNPCFFILNKSNLMHNIPFVPGGIDNLSRDSRSISRDVSVLYIPDYIIYI